MGDILYSYKRLLNKSWTIKQNHNANDEMILYALLWEKPEAAKATQVLDNCFVLSYRKKVA